MITPYYQLQVLSKSYENQRFSRNSIRIPVSINDKGQVMFIGDPNGDQQIGNALYLHEEFSPSEGTSKTSILLNSFKDSEFRDFKSNENGLVVATLSTRNDYIIPSSRDLYPVGPESSVYIFSKEENGIDSSKFLTSASGFTNAHHLLIPYKYDPSKSSWEKDVDFLIDYSKRFEFAAMGTSNLNNNGDFLFGGQYPGNEISDGDGSEYGTWLNSKKSVEHFIHSGGIRKYLFSKTTYNKLDFPDNAIIADNNKLFLLNTEYIPSEREGIPDKQSSSYGLLSQYDKNMNLEQIIPLAEGEDKYIKAFDISDQGDVIAFADRDGIVVKALGDLGQVFTQRIAKASYDSNPPAPWEFTDSNGNGVFDIGEQATGRAISF